MAHTGDSVSGCLEVLPKRVEVFDAAPQRGDADDEVAAASLDNFDLTIFHRYAHWVPPWHLLGVLSIACRMGSTTSREVSSRVASRPR